MHKATSLPTKRAIDDMCINSFRHGRGAISSGLEPWDQCSSPRCEQVLEHKLPEQIASCASTPSQPSSKEDYLLVQRLRTLLQEKHWEEADDLFTDEYLHTVLHATKNGKQRTFEYAAAKLQQSLEWRRQYGASSIKREDVSNALAPNHMWWEGEDKYGRPMLYARPGLMDLKTYSREEYVRAHVYLIEQGLKRMRPGVSSFVLVVDSSGLSTKHFDITRDKQLLAIGTEAYPDRMGALVVGPVNGFIRTSWAILRNLMPKRLADKIVMSKNLYSSVAALLPPDAVPPPFLRPLSAPI